MELCKINSNGITVVVTSDYFSDFGPDPHQFYVYNNLMYFNALTKFNGRELFVFDGTNVQFLRDIYRGLQSSYPSGFVGYNNKVYFTATDIYFGNEVWSVSPTDNCPNDNGPVLLCEPSCTLSTINASILVGDVTYSGVISNPISVEGNLISTQLNISANVSVIGDFTLSGSNLAKSFSSYLEIRDNAILTNTELYLTITFNDTELASVQQMQAGYLFLIIDCPSFSQKFDEVYATTSAKCKTIQVGSKRYLPDGLYASFIVGDCNDEVTSDLPPLDRTAMYVVVAVVAVVLLVIVLFIISSTRRRILGLCAKEKENVKYVE